MAILACLTCIACRDVADPRLPAYARYVPSSLLDQQDSAGIFAVIEIPAGTATIRALDTTLLEIYPFEGPPIDFLPFPGNYGFVAGCARVDTVNNTYKPLPVLVLMEAIETGSVIAIHPVAILVLNTMGDPHPIVVAVPADTALQTVKLTTFVDLITEYDAVRSIIQEWFLNYSGRGMFDLTGWRDEHYAGRLIQTWRIN